MRCLCRNKSIFFKLEFKRWKCSSANLTIPQLENLLRCRINTKIIQENFDDVLRLAHSIREGKVSGSLIMGKLGS